MFMAAYPWPGMTKIRESGSASSTASAAFLRLSHGYNAAEIAGSNLASPTPKPPEGSSRAQPLQPGTGAHECSNVFRMSASGIR